MTRCEICGEPIEYDDVYYDYGDSSPICERCNYSAKRIRKPTRLLIENEPCYEFVFEDDEGETL